MDIQFNLTPDYSVRNVLRKAYPLVDPKFTVPFRKHFMTESIAHPSTGELKVRHSAYVSSRVSEITVMNGTIRQHDPFQDVWGDVREVHAWKGYGQYQYH